MIRAFQSAVSKAYVRAVIPGNAILSIIPEIPEIEGVTIGAQYWATSNLEMVATPMDNAIPEVTDEAVWASSPTLYSDAYTAATGTEAEKVYAGLKASAMWCHYNNDPAVGATYGKLYNWYAAKLLQTDIDAYNAANPTTPWGWKVPTDAEWETLRTTVASLGWNYDGTTDVGTDEDNKQGKALATDYGWEPDGGIGVVGNTDYPAIRNISGFSGLPGGTRYNNGYFAEVGYASYWWSSTEASTDSAWGRGLGYLLTIVGRDSSHKEGGVSVRLLKSIPIDYSGIIASLNLLTDTLDSAYDGTDPTLAGMETALDTINGEIITV